MGREIFAQIRDTDKYDEQTEGYGKENPHVKWDSADSPLELYVCGRDDATNYITCRINEDGFMPLEGDDLKYVLEMMKEYSAKDHAEIDKVKARLDDLLLARKNARNYEEFASFDDEIENCLDWLKHESWSRADSLLELIDETLKEFGKGTYPPGFKPYLVVSE